MYSSYPLSAVIRMLACVGTWSNVKDVRNSQTVLLKSPQIQLDLGSDVGGSAAANDDRAKLARTVKAVISRGGQCELLAPCASSMWCCMSIFSFTANGDPLRDVHTTSYWLFAHRHVSLLSKGGGEDCSYGQVGVGRNRLPEPVHGNRTR